MRKGKRGYGKEWAGNFQAMVRGLDFSLRAGEAIRGREVMSVLTLLELPLRLLTWRIGKLLQLSGES